MSRFLWFTVYKSQVTKM